MKNFFASLERENGSRWTVEINPDWFIIKAWLNDERIRLSAAREFILFKTFNAACNLEELKKDSERNDRI